MKIYTISYHEVQIAGYRTFTSYEKALKEYLKHCITETKTLITSPESSSDGNESDSDGFDEMTCVLEIQELQDEEFVTTKEYDYEVFQMLIEEEEDVPSFLENLEKQLDNDSLSENILELFSE